MRPLSLSTLSSWLVAPDSFGYIREAGLSAGVPSIMISLISISLLFGRAVRSFKWITPLLSDACEIVVVREFGSAGLLSGCRALGLRSVARDQPTTPPSPLLGTVSSICFCCCDMLYCFFHFMILYSMIMFNWNTMRIEVVSFLNNWL